MMLNKEYSFDGGTITPLKNDVMLVTFKEEGKISRQSVENARECKLALMGSKNHFSVIDCCNGLSKFTAEAKSLIMSNIDPFDKNVLTILIVSNTYQKVEANIFKKLHPSSENVVIVKSIQDAFDEIEKEKLNLKAVNIAG